MEKHVILSLLTSPPANTPSIFTGQVGEEGGGGEGGAKGRALHRLPREIPQ